MALDTTTTDEPPRFVTTKLHEQVQAEFTRRIATGRWRPRMPIPNEIALAREVGVSIGTIRKALDDLEAAGIVTRTQGRGTFVRGVEDFSELPPCAHKAAAALGSHVEEFTAADVREIADGMRELANWMTRRAMAAQAGV